MAPCRRISQFMSEESKTPSLRRRMACWLYEGILMFGVVFIADYLFSTKQIDKNFDTSKILGLR